MVLLKLLALIHLFGNQQMSPGLFLPCTGWWPSISSLPCKLSNAFSQTFVYILSRFSRCPQRKDWFVLPSSPLLEVADLLIIITPFTLTFLLLNLFPSFDLKAQAYLFVIGHLTTDCFF